MTQPKFLDVAAGVIFDQRGRFLLTQRPAGKAYAGYWEFPGGKVHAGETPYAALGRELREELGIEVEQAYPWLTRTHVYEHAAVKLHFFRVTRWHGEMRAREGQQLSWQRSWQMRGPMNEQGGGEFTVALMLPANGPILRSLALPAIYAISNVAQLGEEDFLLRLRRALDAGLRMVQLREKSLPRDRLRALGERITTVAHASGAIVLVNGDVELAAELGADGVHLTSAQLMRCDARPALGWAGASCHDRAELERAATIALDYAVLGPVKKTPTHPDAALLGWAHFAALIKDYPLPVYAIGGLAREDLGAAYAAGAHGLALMRAAW